MLVFLLFSFVCQYPIVPVICGKDSSVSNSSKFCWKPVALNFEVYFYSVYDTSLNYLYRTQYPLAWLLYLYSVCSCMCVYAQACYCVHVEVIGQHEIISFHRWNQAQMSSVLLMSPFAPLSIEPSQQLIVTTLKTN